MSVRDRLAIVDVALDDLQSGIEAGSRAAQTLHADTNKLDGLVSPPLFRAVVRHIENLQACARDQRAAMQELRRGVTRLQEELKRSNGAIRPPPDAVNDRHRG